MGSGTAPVERGLVERHRDAVQFDRAHQRVDAVPGRRYGIYVYAWLETNGGAPRGGGPLGYSRIEIDASVPFVVAEETLL